MQDYIKAVERFAKRFHRPSDQLNHNHLREYQAYLLRERKLGPRLRSNGSIERAQSTVPALTDS